MTEVLLTGNTGYLTESFIKNTFPDCHIFIDGDCAIKGRKKNIVVLHWTRDEKKKAFFENCEADLVIYFSYYLTFHGQQAGEMENLRMILQFCARKQARFIYLAGPEPGYLKETGKTVLARSAVQLCAHYAGVSHFPVRILCIPYLYSAVYTKDYLFRLFSDAKAQGMVSFPEASEQHVFFINMDDLGELLYRIIDHWEDPDTPDGLLFVPDAFSLEFAQLGDGLQKLFPGLIVEYDEKNPIQELEADDHILRRRYGWFPKISILAELPWLYSEFQEHTDRPATFFTRLKALLTRSRGLWKAGETLGAFVLMQLLEHAFNGQVQFRLIDIRLLFIVIIATIHGMNMGLFAAALASVSLAGAYMAEGTRWMTLFYEPSNWLPFIFYFITGAVCGYVQMKRSNDMKFVSVENKLIQEKFYFMQTLYQDAYQEKRELKRQILASRDSFGKIFDITRKLDAVAPQEIFLRTIWIMEDVLDNHSIMIYSFGKNKNFARLQAASRQIMPEASRSLDVNDFREAMGDLEEGRIWVNTGLLPHMPMYLMGIRRGGRLVLMIAVSKAEFTQMTLAYQNMIKILCGLVETALLRALDHQEALYEEQHQGDSLFMTSGYFLKNLALYQSMREEKIADYTLLRLDRGNMTLDEARSRLSSRIRETDAAGILDDGCIYLILHQTGAGQAQTPVQRLTEAGFSCRIISDIDHFNTGAAKV